VIRSTESDPGSAVGDRRRPFARRLPVWRIRVTGGLVGILCCVGPTVLALIGVIGAGTAHAWANDLYDGYAWWFRLAGLGVLAGLVYLALKRRDVCSIAGVRELRGRFISVLAIAIGTYVVLYAVTTWLGTFAR
jgi:dipeptide/tripeptide permease